MIRRPPRSTRVRSSAASDVYKRQVRDLPIAQVHILYFIEFDPFGTSHALSNGWKPAHVPCLIANEQHLFVPLRVGVIRHVRFNLTRNGDFHACLFETLTSSALFQGLAQL